MSRTEAKNTIKAVFKENAGAGITGSNSQGALCDALDIVYDDKQDLVASATNGNLVKTDSDGQTQDAGISASLVSEHLSATDNPHSTTKAQVGLGNVDNTSDANKPVSNAVNELVQPIKADVESLVESQQVEPNYEELPLLCGQPMILFGNGTPQEAIVPDNWRQFADGGYNWNGLPSALGQQYINYAVNTGGRYIAVKNGAYELKWLNC